jgi:hypothetical protein
MEKFDRTYAEFFVLYPEKREFFVSSEINRNKLKAFESPEYKKQRKLRKTDLWTSEMKEKLASMWRSASKEELLKEFPNSTFFALANVVNKMRKEGFNIPERINRGRFVKKGKLT